MVLEKMQSLQLWGFLYSINKGTSVLKFQGIPFKNK